MAELVIVHIVEVRQLRQRGPLLHQVPTARRPANRLQDVLGGEGWEIHALGSGQRDGFTCPSHVLGPHSGHRLHPAFRIRRPALRSRPADGFPVYGKTIALIYLSAFPDWEYVSAYASKASAYSVASRLCTLQCRAAEIPPETDVDASNPRPGAAAGSLSHGQSARSCRTRHKRLDKRLIVRHPSNSRGYIPLQKAHGTGSKMVGDGFKALSGPTRRQGGRREGGRNG